MCCKTTTKNCQDFIEPATAQKYSAWHISEKHSLCQPKSEFKQILQELRIQSQALELLSTSNRPALESQTLLLMSTFYRKADKGNKILPWNLRLFLRKSLV